MIMDDDTNTIIRKINNKLAIKPSKFKKRKVVTLTNIKKGTLLLIEKALASIIKEGYIKEYCNYCHKDSVKLSMCSRCHSSFYCSKECQRKAYKYHKSECMFLNKHPELAISSIRLMNQILQKIKENEETKKYFYELIDHYKEFLENNDESTIDFMKQLAEYEKEISGYEGEIDSLMKMFNKVNCNALTITNNSLFSYAGGLFLQASNINHDCNPNCTLYFIGDTLYLKAVKDLNEGEEITISYVPYYDSCRNRQDNLKDYYFTCQCSRCLEYKDQLYLDPIEGIKCQTKGCDGYISHVEFNSCPKCHQKLPIETENKVKNIIRHFSTNESKLIDIKIPDYIANQVKWLEDLLEEQKKILHPQNLYIFSTLNKIDDIILDNDKQQNEFIKTKKTMNNYEIYCYCQNQHLNPSCYKTFKMYYLLTNALNEVFDYIQDYHLTGKKLRTYVKKKLNAIQGSTLSKQLESEAKITFNEDYFMYSCVKRTLEGYRNLKMASGY